MRTYGVQRARPAGGQVSSPGWMLSLDGQTLRVLVDLSEALSIGARMAQSDWVRRSTPAEVVLLDDRGRAELFARFGEGQALPPAPDARSAA